MTLTIRKPYDPSARFHFSTTGESLTKQSHRAECDINTIMLKWQKTGIIDHRNSFEGKYGDFTNVPGDYHEAQNSVLEANEMFLTLPSKIREKFANDPGVFLDYATNPDNADDMVKLGLTEGPLPALIEEIEPKPPEPKTPPKTDKKGE